MTSHALTSWNVSMSTEMDERFEKYRKEVSKKRELTKAEFGRHMMTVWEKKYLETKNKLDMVEEQVADLQSKLDSDLNRVKQDLKDLMPNQEKKSA